mmetsp:Transcript_8428/g.37635  ORF Transcript_8428/g.37635 Transcript_8428/m.37635 type:complete len:132 (+) Transcript_8428:1479-1874(+)
MVSRRYNILYGTFQRREAIPAIGCLIEFGMPRLVQVYGRAPFVAESVLDIYEAITKESLQFPSSPKVSRNLQDLLSKMLTKEPRARVRLVDIISHPWFEGRIKQKASIKPIRVTDNDIANAIKRATYVVTE